MDGKLLVCHLSVSGRPWRKDEQTRDPVVWAWDPPGGRWTRPAFDGKRRNAVALAAPLVKKVSFSLPAFGLPTRRAFSFVCFPRGHDDRTDSCRRRLDRDSLMRNAVQCKAGPAKQVSLGPRVR